MDPNLNLGNYNLPEEDNIDIKRYLSLFISNWYWFAISLFVAFTIAYGINRYSEDIFTVSSTLLINEKQNGGGLSLTENLLPGSNVFNSQQKLNNEIGILKSFRLNKRVIDSLSEFRIVYFGIGRRNLVESRLYKRCPFQVIAENMNFQPGYTKVHVRITSDTTFGLVINGYKVENKVRFGRRYKDFGFNFIINLRDPEHFKFNPEESNKYYFYFASSEELANFYRGKLGVTPIEKDATLVSLSASGFVPEQEVDYLNKLMELYLSQGLESKNQTADSTIIFIDRQLRTISDSLNKAEDKLQNFRLENKLVDLSKEGSHIQNRLELFENGKTTLELQYKYYEYLKEYLNSKNESGDIVSPSVTGVTDQLLGRLVQELAELQQKKKQLSMNLSMGLPPVNLLEENIITAREALSENIKSNIVTIEHSIDDVKSKLSQVDTDIQKLPGTERKLINIQRKFDINNTVYTYLLEKRAEAGIARASNVSDNKIIDGADIFNRIQIKPKPGGNNLKALLLGLLIPGLIIALLYYFNNTILDNGDITKKTNVPIIGYISHNDDKKEIPVIDSPRSALSESFRAVRTTLKYLIKEKQNPVIAITSTVSSEGKTFISINLAVITAMLGKKVLLIGLDLRKPRIHKILGLKNDEGMSTYLCNNCEYNDVIEKTSINNLHYAASGPVPPNPAELIDDERMHAFIEKAKLEFDYIFIDTPPLAVVSDTLLLSRFVDINIFIVRQRYSSKNTLELIQELYQSDKLKNMGIVINDISLTGYYGYGLRYGYYKGYGYAYGKNYYGQYSYGRYGYSDKEHGYYNT
jgi:tyrosine-protein kinase Etk/Wzc